MAGAEARAVWQRAVNRCFVQEDAKRAPKLTCYNQSSSSSKQQVGEEEEESYSRLVLDPKNQLGCFTMPRNPNFNDMFPNNNTRLWSHIVEKKVLETEEQDKSLNTDNFQEFIELMETKESLVGFDDDECSEKKLNELGFDPSSPWNPLSSEKVGPWWRTTDKDELASLVAQRSLEYVENCDLPTPQKLNRSYNGSPRSDGFRPIHGHGTSNCKNRAEDSSESGLSKSELLEALRRSQTRAREAENMAKEAYAEKEHLVKLLFKQASELFGYKQWLKLLQLEALYVQIKNKKEPEVSIPWSNPKARKSVRKRRSKRDKPNGAKYAVGLALGMSLVGAGLLLGWTVGWMQMLSF